MKLLSFLFRSSKGVRRSRAVVILVVFTGALSGLISTSLLALINSALNKSARPSFILWSFVGLCVALPVVRFISEMFLIRLASGATFGLRMQLSRRILSTPLRQLEELGPHRLFAALTEDIPAITNAAAMIPTMCMHAAIVIGCLAFIGWLSWAGLLALLAFLGIGVLSYQWPMTRAMRHFQMARDEADSLFKHFRAMIDGVKELKLHRRRRLTFMNRVLESTGVTLRQHFVDGSTIYNAARSWGQVLFFVLIGLLLFAPPSVTFVSQQVLTGYILVLLYMMTPLEVMLNALPVLGRANVSVNKLENLGLSLSSEQESDNVQEAAHPTWQRLELVGITHAYYREGEDNNFTLGPINLTFRPDEVVFLSGGNGSGKTTLAKLITGLYAPESGEIRLDGRTITEADREQYRQLFSVVFSDFFLFESLLGIESQQLDERARGYLSQLQLEHKVQVKDGALSTISLSQGQRKRLALLTAYLEDRPFYIFDEWAADQDPYFKSIFYLEILPSLKARGKAVLVISHDDAYYHLADRLIKLEYGKVEFDKPLNDARPAANPTANPAAIA